MKIREIMTRGTDFITEDQTIEQAAVKMKESGVGDMPVVAGGEAVGMLTDRDITVRIVAMGLDPQTTYVTDAMTEGIVACREDDDVETAARLMSDKRVRRLLVMNERRKLSGIVSLGDLAKSINKNLAGEVLEKISSPAHSGA
jgi:CBS domain-containing protein